MIAATIMILVMIAVAVFACCKVSGDCARAEEANESRTDPGNKENK